MNCCASKSNNKSPIMRNTLSTCIIATHPSITHKLPNFQTSMAQELVIKTWNNTKFDQNTLEHFGLRQMRLMCTPPALWNHPVDGFEHQKLEQVSNCKLGPRNLKSLKLGLRKVLIQALKSKILHFPIWHYRGNFFSHHSMMYKRMTSLVGSTWVICH